MTTTNSRRLLIVWAVLTAMTLVYVWMDHTVDESGTLRASTAVTVILIALVKVRIIFREFMEVRHAP
ncbi:MAG: cytochrome C oxidase subunit IV family protein, partial [Actinomycetota bacterium]|nr:cytochrome C oxidase subunit IV family protein [Actinomycetota bacterium]